MHIVLLRAGIPALENLARLEQLPDSGFTVVALPMKIREGAAGRGDRARLRRSRWAGRAPISDSIRT